VYSKIYLTGSFVLFHALGAILGGGGGAVYGLVAGGIALTPIFGGGVLGTVVAGGLMVGAGVIALPVAAIGGGVALGLAGAGLAGGKM
jgi:hypothetical protein